MTTKSVNIVGGPSKWDLMLAVFDREDDEDPREVMFLVEDWEADDPKRRSVNIHITIPAIKQEHGSCEGWQIDGTVVDGPKDILKQRVKGEYDTKARKGKLELLGDGNPPEKETIDCHGVIIHKEWGRIVAAENGPYSGQKIRLGDMVVSNGRFAIDAGAKGIVVNICEPFTKGRSNNILDVWFEGRSCDTQMKFKDLQL